MEFHMLHNRMRSSALNPIQSTHTTMPDEKQTKDLTVTSIADAKTKIPDIQVIGNGDLWQLLCKASSKEGKWMKSSKAMNIQGFGVALQVTTQQGDQISEALTAIPNVKIVDDENGGKKLVGR